MTFSDDDPDESHLHGDGCACEACAGAGEDDGETELLDDGDFLDLRPVSDNQFACSGEDLESLLNYGDEGVDEAFFAKLGLTARPGELCGEPYHTFDEVLPGRYYLVTLTEDADATEFSMAQAVKVEEFSEKCFNELDESDSDDDGAWPCEGDCENCPQDCVGKLPRLP